MKCRYCENSLSPLRSLTDGVFCCDEHRSAYEWEAAKASAEPVSGATPEAAAIASHGAGKNGFAGNGFEENYSEEPALGAPFHAVAPEMELNSSAPMAAERAAVSDSEFSSAEFSNGNTHAAEFAQGGLAVESPQAAQRIDSSEAGGAEEHAEDGGEPYPIRPRSTLVRQVHETLHWLANVWKTAPFELKIITLLLPILLGVAVTPTNQRAEPASPAESKMRHMLDERWKILTEHISQRKAVAFTDDFRSGLDAWNSHSKLTSTWSYDAAGFVEPGPLAIFKPTADMSDYRFEYLGEIDRRAMGFAFRAKNLDNYYAVKFVIVQPGPLPVVHIIRYAVINGKAGPRVEKPLPITTRADMFYRVAVEVRGGDFTILVQGQVVDFWSDNRLRQGGVGFFCDRGERARLRWVEVTHQYDTLGKLCAFLAPYGAEESN